MKTERLDLSDSCRLCFNLYEGMSWLDGVELSGAEYPDDFDTCATISKEKAIEIIAFLTKSFNL